MASNAALWTMAVRPQSMDLHTMVLFSLVEEMQIPSSFGWYEGKNVSAPRRQQGTEQAAWV